MEGAAAGQGKWYRVMGSFGCGLLSKCVETARNPFGRAASKSHLPINCSKVQRRSGKRLFRYIAGVQDVALNQGSPGLDRNNCRRRHLASCRQKRAEKDSLPAQESAF